MRRGIAAIGAVCALAVAAVALAAGSDDRPLAFDLGVHTSIVAVALDPGREQCEVGVHVPVGFSAARLTLGTYGRPGPPLAVVVRDTFTRRPLARGGLPAGSADGAAAAVRVTPAVARGRLVDVCVRNAGPGRVALYGGPPRDAQLSAIGSPAGRPGPRADIALDFLRAKPRSALSLVPDVFERAAVFRPGFVGSWTFWLLLVAVALGLPLLLAAALRRSFGREPPGSGPTAGAGAPR